MCTQAYYTKAAQVEVVEKGLMEEIQRWGGGEGRGEGLMEEIQRCGGGEVESGRAGGGVPVVVVGGIGERRRAHGGDPVGGGRWRGERVMEEIQRWWRGERGEPKGSWRLAAQGHRRLLPPAPPHPPHSCKYSMLPPPPPPFASRYFLLTQTDNLWKEHLQSIKFLQQAVGLRG